MSRRGNGAAYTELVDAIGRIVAELDDVTLRPAGPATEYLRGGRVFAEQRGAVVVLRLGSDIAEAALPPPGPGPAARGDDWIEFQPDIGQPQDMDRLRAWLTIAWRGAQRPN